MASELSVSMIADEPATGVLLEDSVILCQAPGLSIHPLDTSCTEPQYMVRLANGKFIRISHKLCDVLAEIDGRAGLEQIAANLTCKWNIVVLPADVEAVVEKFLMPHRLIARADDPEAGQELRCSRQGTDWVRKFLLQDFFFSFRLIPSNVVARIARYTAPLFNRPLAFIAILSLLLVNFSAYHEFTGLRDSGQFKLTDPVEYLWVLLIVFLTIVFHEFGHASAVVRYGGIPDHIGFGLYFIYPALYANVNQSWHFTRRQRTVIDLGGIYFQLMASMVWYLLYLRTHRLGFLLAFLILEFLWVYSLIPFFKFDGYWFVSDALGVPNLRKRAFQLLGYKILVLAGKRARSKADLGLPPAITRWVLSYALSSVVFTGAVIWALIRYAPARFAQYPGYVQSVFSGVAQTVSNGSYSMAAVVLIHFAIRSLTMVGLTMVGVSFVASMYQTVRNFIGRRSYDARG